MCGAESDVPERGRADCARRAGRGPRARAPGGDAGSERVRVAGSRDDPHGLRRAAGGPRRRAGTGSARLMDLLVVGDLNADLVLSGGEIEPTFGQREQLVEHAELVLGGSGGIMAAGAAKLGLEVAMVACVGRDALGSAMIDALDQAGVDTRAVIRTSEAATGVSVALARPGDRAILTAPGALSLLRAEDVPAGT